MIGKRLCRDRIRFARIDCRETPGDSPGAAALSNAEGFLSRADRDFSGHRTKAVELVHGAQKELNEALASDKQ